MEPIVDDDEDYEPTGKWDFQDDTERRRAIKTEAKARVERARAEHDWVVKTTRTAVWGTVLLASFYATPDFWPNVVLAVKAAVAH